jgi:hypothetical protein
MMLNHHLFQKFKLIEKNKFNHLIKYFNILPHVWVQTPLISEVQHMRY